MINNVFHQIGISYWLIVWYLLSSVGYAAVFKKCGAKSSWSYVPVVREYWLGKCADCEAEGRILALISACNCVIHLFFWGALDDSVGGGGAALQPIILSVVLFLGIVDLIYEIKRGSGLCRIFGKKRRWMLLMLFPETSWIAGFVFGYGKAQPKYRIGERERMAAPVGEAVRFEEKEGLTVAIKERSVMENLGKKVLLQDIHLAVKPRHMVLLLGGSGCGKTTFINAVTGYEKADATVTLGGRDIYKNYKKMQHEIGMVPQQNLMRFSDLVQSTVADAAATRLPVQVSAKERRERITKVLEDVGLLQSQNNKVGKLSGGQLRRLSIAMELIADPDLFVLDEPDSGLDGIMARGLMKDLRRIADRGKIVMVITHTPDRVIDLFDDVIVLAKDAKRVGRLAFFGSITEARAFFECETMEQILSKINSKGDGGEGMADEFITRFGAYRAKEADYGTDN